MTQTRLKPWETVLIFGIGGGVSLAGLQLAMGDSALKSLVRGGRIVTCGATTGDQRRADLRRVFIRQLQIYGSTLGHLAELRDLVRFCAQHPLRPVMDQVYPLEQAHAALDRLASGQQFGKIALGLA